MSVTKINNFRDAECCENCEFGVYHSFYCQTFCAYDGTYDYNYFNGKSPYRISADWRRKHGVREHCVCDCFRMEVA